MFSSLAFARVVKSIFLGYVEGVQGYRLWKLDPKPSKLIISKDVTFDETRTATHSENSECKREKAHIEVGHSSSNLQKDFFFQI